MFKKTCIVLGSILLATSILLSPMLFIDFTPLSTKITKSNPTSNVETPIVTTRVNDEYPSLASFELPVFPTTSSKKMTKHPIITLEKNDIIVIDDVITDELVSKLQVQLMKMISKLDNKAPIYVIMNTPGGSVRAGLRLMEVLQAQNRPIHTITLFSASMGFILVQGLDDRLIVPTGTLMSHRTTMSIQGKLNGELENRLGIYKREDRYLDVLCADRMGLKTDDYQKLIFSEYWVKGFESVNQNAADKVVLVKCGNSLNSTHTSEFSVLGISVSVEFSDCPLIEVPLSFKINDGGFGDNLDVKTYINLLYTDKTKFVQDYIINNRYMKFIGETHE